MRSWPSRLISLGLLDRALAPAPAPERVEALKALPFAHRGLHGDGLIENSRGAFEAAIAAGHGIELDVRVTLDGQALVFHDTTLDRLAEATGPVDGRTAAELRHIRLKGTNETIPDLPEILELIGARVPLLIEVKAPERAVTPICAAVLGGLRGYGGPVGIMSFNPEVARWFARHAPQVTRGLVVTEEGKPQRKRLERRLALWRSRPDFLAYDIGDLPSRFAARARARGIPVFTWTCRSAEDAARASLHADQIIHELPL